MSALICDICGGNLVMDASGETAICESCGMKHSKDRVKVKVQEIKGVVEVTKGDAEKERLLKNAETFLHFNEIEKAHAIYTQLSQEYPDDGRTLFGLFNITKIRLFENLSEITAYTECVINSYVNYKDERHASEIALCLGQFYTLYNKLHLLNYDEYATKILECEEDFIKTYDKKQLPFINDLSAYVLRHGYIPSAGNSVQEWACKISDEYADKFYSGETNEVFWGKVNPYKQFFYPAIRELLKKAYDNAQLLNELSEIKLFSIIHSLNIKEVKYDNKLRCTFWYHTTIIFEENGYDESTVRSFKTDVSVNEKNIRNIINSRMNQDEDKCKEAHSLISNVSKIYECKEAVNEIVKRFGVHHYYRSELQSNDSYDCKIADISIDGIDYSYKYCILRGEETKSEKVLFDKYINFEEIVSILEKYNKIYIKRKTDNKCIYCEGTFKGLFNKVCSSCGKPKNY